MNAQSLLSFNKQVDDQNDDSLLKQFAETLFQQSIMLDETEKSADEKADGRVLIRGSSPTPPIRKWRKFEIDEKAEAFPPSLAAFC